MKCFSLSYFWFWTVSSNWATFCEMIICLCIAVCWSIGLRPNSLHLCMTPDYKNMIQTLSNSKYSHVYLMENSTCIRHYLVRTITSNGNSYGIFFPVRPNGCFWQRKCHLLVSRDGRVFINTELNSYFLSWVLFCKMQNRQKDSEWICKYILFH